MKLQLRLEQMNLRAFLEAAIEDGKDIMTPPVLTVENLEDCWSEDLEIYPSEQLAKWLLEDNQYLYVNFSEPGIEQEVACLDGNTYYLMSQEEYEEELESLEEDDDFLEGIQPLQNLYLGEANSLGYVLKYDNDVLTIQSGIFHLHGKRFTYSGWRPSETEIELKEDVELFEEPMRVYLEQYLV